MSDHPTPGSSSSVGLAPQSPITRPVPNQRGVVITDESTVSKVLVKAAPGTPAAEALPVAFGRSASGSGEVADDTLVLGTRPDEWLLLFGDADVVQSRIPREGFVSVIDWSHSRGMLRITGEQAADALAKVCNIDFSDGMMPNGAVTSTGVAGVGTDMVRNDRILGDEAAPSYLLLFDRSFGQSLYDALIDAATEFRT